jgi:hypothetical protein
VSGLDLQTRLDAGAVDAGGRHRRRRQMPGRDRACGRRAHIGQIAIVQEHGLDQPGLRRKQHHKTVQARQAERGIVEEAGADLDRKALEARNIGGLDVDLAIGVGDRHRQNRRHHHLARGERGESPLDRVDDGEIEPHRRAQLVFGQDGDVMRHKALP